MVGRLYFIAVVMVTGVQLSGCATGRVDRASESPCDAAVAFARSVPASRGESTVFSATSETLSPDVATGTGWWKVAAEGLQPVASPPADLLKQLSVQGGRSAIAACGSLRADLKARGIGFSDQAVLAAAADQSAIGFHSKIIRTVTLPVVSADGQQAVLAASQIAGPLAGGGFLHFLNRNGDGKWRVVASRSLWMS